MNKAELLEIIANGKNSGVEFKRDDLRPEQLATEIVALVNLRGGRIFLGVEDDGTITGIQRDDLEHWIMNTALRRYVHPMILPFYEEIEVDAQRRVAMLTISQGTARPYVVRHRGGEVIYVRIGSASRRASREQQMCLFHAGGLLHTEKLPVSRSGLDDLSRERLSDYLRGIMGDQEIPATDDAWRRRLCDLDLMTEQESAPPVCTVAGLVLFGNAPGRLLPQAGIRWMVFEGTEKSCKSPDDRLINEPLLALWKGASNGGVRRRVGNGLIETLMDAMRPFVSEEDDTVGESMRRERHWHYPPEVLREAVVNAVAHRDWTRNEQVEVVRYSDRLEILSPGAMQNGMTVEKMIAGRRSARNSLIVSILRDYGYVDAKGMGVRNKIIPFLRAQNDADPEFTATEDYFKIVMRRARRPSARALTS